MAKGYAAILRHSMQKNRRVFFIFVFLVVFIAGAIAITIWAKKKVEPHVAVVNGEIISISEFEQQLAVQRANTYHYFKNKYKVEYSSDFWTMSYDGEIPQDYAKKNALNECIEIKLQQILAKKKGLIHDIDYDAFLQGLQKENERRKKAVENKQVIYGPVTYDASTYFSYVFSNLVIQLKQRLEGEEIIVSENEMQDYYSLQKDKHFKKTDTTARVVPSYMDNTGTADNQETMEAVQNIDNSSVSGGYFSYDEVKPFIKARCIDTKYEQIVMKMVEEAVVEVDRKVYDQIKVN